jgi:hypothetical protein
MQINTALQLSGEFNHARDALMKESIRQQHRFQITKLTYAVSSVPNFLPLSTIWLVGALFKHSMNEQRNQNDDGNGYAEKEQE